MLQVVFDHLLRHLAGGDAEVATHPEMPAPVALFQLRKHLKEFRQGAPLICLMISLGDMFGGADTRIWMWSLLAHNPLENLGLKGLARLADQLTGLERNIPLQNMIAILRDKHKVVLDLKNRMATVSILHLY